MPLMLYGVSLSIPNVSWCGTPCTRHEPGDRRISQRLDSPVVPAINSTRSPVVRMGIPSANPAARNASPAPVATGVPSSTAVGGNRHQASGDLVAVRGKPRARVLSLDRHVGHPAQRGDYFDGVFRLVRPDHSVKDSLAVGEERGTLDCAIAATGQLDRFATTYLLQPQLVINGAVRNVGYEPAVGRDGWTVIGVPRPVAMIAPDSPL
jgi:hypothetical protein